MNVKEAIEHANNLLPGEPAEEDQEDPRWQAIIAVGKYIKSNPEEVWSFITKWGVHPQEDLRMAISTCLLEHLLEHHFENYFSRVERLYVSNDNFKTTLSMCAAFGKTKLPENADRLRKLIENDE